jgi:uncharacterized damage-inducible protein DinB
MAILEPAVALERLKGTPRELVALLATAKADIVQREPAEGEWSPATVVAHLADAELVYSVRIRMTLTADRPYLAAFDENAWVRRFAELETDHKESLARWRALRDANLRILESLEPAEWKLTGLHAERGEVSVAHLADLLVAHDRAHLAQIREGLAEA